MLFLDERLSEAGIIAAELIVVRAKGGAMGGGAEENWVLRYAGSTGAVGPTSDPIGKFGLSISWGQ